MADSLDIHRKLQNKRRALSSGEHKARESATLVPFPISNTQKSIHPALLEMEMRHKEEMAFLKAPVEIDIEDVLKELEQIHANYSKARFDGLIAECRSSVLSATVNAFGLGAVVAGYDKHGGNVDTVHNVRQIGKDKEMEYKNKKEGEAYEKRGKYDGKDYHSDETYIKKGKDLKKQQEAGDLTDGYTGEALQGKKNLDHVVSAEEIHNDPGRVLADLDGKKLANQEDNFVATNETINKTKSNKTVDEFIKYKNEKITENQKKLQELEAKPDKTAEDVSKINKLEKDINNLKAAKDDLMKQKDNDARNAINKDINWAYYTSGKFIKNTAITSGIEAGKMGLQQAMGLLMTNLFDALFCEIRDSYINGLVSPEDDGTLDALKRRVKKILATVVNNWKSVVEAFRDGAISGFISNIVTVIINTFMTTAKNIVRMIREGMFSLFKAVKLVLFRPEGTTWQQACDAALKLIATGVVTLAGIGMEEALCKILEATAALAPFSNIITTVIVGGLTGIATALVVYAIDDIDVFGVRSEEKHNHVLSILKASADQDQQKIDIIYQKIMAPVI